MLLICNNGLKWLAPCFIERTGNSVLPTCFKTPYSSAIGTLPLRIQPFSPAQQCISIELIKSTAAIPYQLKIYIAVLAARRTGHLHDRL
jgi:hypothetical protein